ncbi:hypothetical protein [Marinoscillum sp. MHG1-6]|uniref:hypothetical protein n=1 Tax=Marinoscillum sp. MHG1-6 TaxID=2959627 RepID=UPI002157D631|nr:hypothetical protein [Marinoscillum sp. MHG1-6]
MSEYLKWHYILFIPIAVFGLFEYLIDITFWDDLMHLPRYWQDKGDLFAAGKLSVESSGKFYSYDLYPLIGDKTRRIVSFYAETKPLASYCIYLIPFAYFSRQSAVKFFVCPLLLIVGVLTYSKGFIIVFFMCLFHNFIPKRAYFILLILIPFFVFGAIIYYLGIGIGPLSHISGLYSGLLIILKGNIFGLGLGATGNYSSPLLESLGGGESGFGSMMGQIGIIAFIFYLFLYKVAKSILNRYQKTELKQYYVVYIGFVGWVVNFLYSEAAMGFRGNVFVFLTIGLLLSQQLDDKEKELIVNVN